MATTKVKKCNKGTPCGKSCISAKKNCRVKPGKTSADILSQIASMATSPAAKAESIAIMATEGKLIKSKKVAKSKPPAASTAAVSSAGYKPSAGIRDFEAFLNNPNNKKFGSDLVNVPEQTIDRLKGLAPNLDSDAIKAGVYWTTSGYEPMNQFLLDPEDPNYKVQNAAPVSKHLHDNWDKLPKFNENSFKALYPKGSPYGEEGREYGLTRKVNMTPATLTNYLGRKLTDAASNKGVYSTDTFEAFSAEPNWDWEPGSNLTVFAKPKKDTNAAAMDAFKPPVFAEKEALFNLGAKFKLSKIESTNKDYQEAIEKMKQLKYDSVEYLKLETMTMLMDPGQVTMYVEEVE